MNERTLQAAAAELERTWLKSATDKELDLLLLSGERPDLFEKKDEGGLRVLLAFDASSEGGAKQSTLEVVPANERQIAENAAELVFRRTRLRSRLGLPNRDCGARRPNPACSCLTETLDELGAEESPHKAAIIESARKRHVKPVRPWRRPREAKPSAAQAIPTETVLQLPPDPVTETPTRPDLIPRWRQRLEPPHPLSWAAFRAEEEGRIDWRTREF